MSGILPTLFLPGDVAALQGRLLQAVRGTDDAVRVCGAVDTSTRAAWGAFYVAVSDYASSNPSFWSGGASADQGQQLERELYAWQQKLAGLGCKNLVFNPGNPINDPSQNALVQALRYGSIAALAVGGAYVVGKIVEVIPRKR